MISSRTDQCESASENREEKRKKERKRAIIGKKQFWNGAI